jgi:hypothetical protein
MAVTDNFDERDSASPRPSPQASAPAADAITSRHFVPTPPAEAAEVDEALRYEAESYARAFNVTVEEASRRLEWQLVSSATADAIRVVAGERLVGTWTKHEPEWRLVAHFTGGPEGLDEVYAMANRADVPVEIRTGAKWTMAELLAIQTEVLARLNREGDAGGGAHPEGSIMIDLVRGSPAAADPTALEAELEATYGVDFRVEVVGAFVDQAGSR